MSTYHESEVYCSTHHNGSTLPTNRTALQMTFDDYTGPGFWLPKGVDGACDIVTSSCGIIEGVECTRRLSFVCELKDIGEFYTYYKE